MIMTSREQQLEAGAFIELLGIGGYNGDPMDSI